MAYRLAPDIHVATIDEHAIILDAGRDRYTKLAPALSRILNRCLQDAEPDADPARVASLCELGLIEPADSPEARGGVDVLVAEHSIEDCARRPGRVHPAITALRLAAARRQLRVRGLAATLAQARQRASSCQWPDDDHAASIALGFRASREWLPFSRACLPDSLALHAEQCARSVRTTLVIGVKDHPFYAHCWVQSGSVVLTDPVDDIRALVPILAL